MPLHTAAALRKKKKKKKKKFTGLTDIPSGTRKKRKKRGSTKFNQKKG